MKDPRAVVAIILAMSILVFVVSGTLVREILYAFTGSEGFLATDPEVAAKWENVVSVIVGVLAGYVMGRNEVDGTP